MTAVYVDTSALAKRYFPEPRADEFGAFPATRQSVLISRLTVVKLRCLVARRRRAGVIDSSDEAQILIEFDEDVQLGAVVIQPIDDRHAQCALTLLARVAPIPLRALDALHLGIAQEVRATTVATADKVMAEAGAALGREVVRFD